MFFRGCFTKEIVLSPHPVEAIVAERVVDVLIAASKDAHLTVFVFIPAKQLSNQLINDFYCYLQQITLTIMGQVIIVAGTWFQRKDPLMNPLGKTFYPPVDLITLDASGCSVCLSDVMRNVEPLVRSLEGILNEQFNDQNTISPKVTYCSSLGRETLSFTQLLRRVSGNMLNVVIMAETRALKFNSSTFFGTRSIWIILCSPISGCSNFVNCHWL